MRVFSNDPSRSHSSWDLLIWNDDYYDLYSCGELRRAQVYFVIGELNRWFSTARKEVREITDVWIDRGL